MDPSVKKKMRQPRPRKTGPNKEKICRECKKPFLPDPRSPLQVNCSRKCADDCKRRLRADDRAKEQSGLKVSKPPVSDDGVIYVDDVMTIRIQRR